jgi:HEAT repeat protein
MTSNVQRFACFRQVRCRIPIVFLILLAVFGRCLVPPALADGVFVFKWDKQSDINEPAQKAIIVHDAGREDLLLQVKFEGPIEEFGWLVPVPSVPKVEKGSMDAFYELSELTQRHFGVAADGETLGLASAGRGEVPVKVLEIKTVGAYEVAILSAKDSGSLARWLAEHGYSIPEGKSGIVEDYIRQGWFFVAARIQLNNGVGFRMASSASPKSPTAAAPSRQKLKQKLASGELHPLLISFDTSNCIYPLKISAVGGKPSEVSLYVLSAEPLLDRMLFDRACDKLDRDAAEWEHDKAERQKSREMSLRNMRTIQLAAQLYAEDHPPGSPKRPAQRRRWSAEEVNATANEDQPLIRHRHESLDDSFWASPQEMLKCLHVTPDQISKSAKHLPRLNGKSWYLTKQVHTYDPAEMEDLEFQPAVLALAAALPRPAGRIAAELLVLPGVDSLDLNSLQVLLLAASWTGNSVERANASAVLGRLKDPRLVELVLGLLEDNVPQVRLHAVQAADMNWDRRLADPLVALFRDPNPEIQSSAVGCLCTHESAERIPVYLEMLRDPDLNIRRCSMGVLSRLAPDAIPQDVLIAMLKEPDPEVQEITLHTIFKYTKNADAIPRADLLPLLSSPHMEIVYPALHLIQGTGIIRAPGSPPLDESRQLSSEEAVRLTTNQLAMARLAGLRILKRNADAKAVELTLPLLRDPNPIVQSRAFDLLRTVTDQDFPESDPAQWERWWAANKSGFVPRRTTP